ncbi:MAG: VOC family protein [Rhizobacter sp.]|nr:VOC family protein [Rhizobacter sp.]
MISHVSLGTKRYAESVGFYQNALGPLGAQLLRDTGKEAAFGVPPQWSFFLYPVDASEPGVTASGMHLAFQAASRAQVIGVYERALSAEASSLFSPRERPDISATYFGAMFTDLDGHRIEVMTDAA